MQIEIRQYKEGQIDTNPWPAEMNSSQTLAIVFGASSLLDRPSVMAHILDRLPLAHVIGCSTSGEIFGAQVSDDSLVLGMIRFDHTTLASATAAVHSPDDSFAAGETLARHLKSPGLRAVFVLSDGLAVNGSKLVCGLNEVLGDSVAVTGGLAGDGPRFERTWVIQDRRPQRGFVTAVGFYGDRVRIGHGSKGGWDKFGPERQVTKSKGNVLYELDQKPALRLYKEYLGDRAAGLPSTGLLFPLALRTGISDGKTLVRTILAVNETDQSMTFAGDIPEGSFAQLMRANFDRLIHGASEAGELATIGQGSTRHDRPTLAVAISCVGRRLVLGERTEEEIEATLQVLPHGTRQIGFYSYGEISPYASGSCDLHNQTMTLTTFSES